MQDIREVADAIANQIDLESRSVVWLIFTSQNPSYFKARDLHVRTSNDIRTETRLDVPVPRYVKEHHIHHLIDRLIMDGYEFYGFVVYPGKEIPWEQGKPST